MALDVVDQLVRSNAVDMVVVDSVAALVPRAELEAEMADMQMGLQARLMSKVGVGKKMRVLILNNSWCVLLPNEQPANAIANWCLMDETHDSAESSRA